ncbi:uncharacterized protein LOC131211940 [Anopheles bellator]|uniref:uncharacterized protein LOC131211940 n=1 Tax=Anopheles bellator TaxID=139047 RepID=UPI002648CA34|nr:uncharacterized protein LOC131211940 [Anopheles bellator]
MYKMGNFLLEFAQQFKCENKFQAVLKSALLKQSLKDEDLVPQQYREMCRKCAVPWKEGYFSVVLLPASSQSLKQVARYEAMSELTKQQKSLLKYLKSRTRRIAKFTCSICSYKTRVRLDQRTAIQKPAAAPVAHGTSCDTEPNEEGVKEDTKKKRKRRGKSDAGSGMHQNNSAKSQPRPTAASKSSQLTLQRKAAVKQFTPKDFREIQKMLAAKIEGTDAKPNKNTNGRRGRK